MEWNNTFSPQNVIKIVYFLFLSYNYSKNTKVLTIYSTFASFIQSLYKFFSLLELFTRLKSYLFKSTSFEQLIYYYFEYFNNLLSIISNNLA